MNPDGTYTIPSWRMDTLRDRIGKLSRRAAKLKCQPITIEELGYKDIPDTKNPGAILRFYTVSIVGEPPKIAGWTFVATLQHVAEVGNVIRTVPGETIPSSYRTQEAWCDHCQTHRYRKDTYIVRQDETYKQVGSSCLADFLGHNDPKFIASMMEMWTVANEICESEEDWDGAPREAHYIDMVGYLQFVAAVIRTEGWISKGKARDTDKISTADSAFQEMFPDRSTPEWKRMKPTEEDAKTVDEALAWAEEHLLSVDLEILSDYEFNLRVVITSGLLEHRTIGLAASLIPAAQRAIEKEKMTKYNREHSKHFGTVGKREVFTLTVVSMRELGEARFGITYLYKMVDHEGNQAVWFASRNTLTVDKTYKVKATIKDHSEYNGTAQTVLNRIKIEEEVHEVS